VNTYEIWNRSYFWLKVINYQSANVIVSGYRKDDFGLVLNYKDGNFAGIMELGVPRDGRREIYLMKKKDENDKFVFIEPVSCYVRYRNITKLACCGCLYMFQ